MSIVCSNDNHFRQVSMYSESFFMSNLFYVESLLKDTTETGLLYASFIVIRERFGKKGLLIRWCVWSGDQYIYSIIWMRTNLQKHSKTRNKTKQNKSKQNKQKQETKGKKIKNKKQPPPPPKKITKQ